MISGWLPAAIKASNAPPSGSSSTVTFLPGLAALYLSASVRMVSIMAPCTTAMRVPPATFGGRVAVAVGTTVAVAAPPWVATGATVSVAAPPAVAPVGEATGACVVAPVAQADRTIKASTMLRRTETDFHSLNLDVFILLLLCSSNEYD